MITRWQKALIRGQNEDLLVMTQDKEKGKYVVSSSTDPNRFYEVSVVGRVAHCECQARDGVCKHRALVLDRLGLLEVQQDVPFVMPPGLPEVTEEEKIRFTS